jgi:predicted acetyltransferase
MKLQEISKLKNINLLSKIIFFNFLYLQNENNIDFSINSIENLLKQTSLLGWFLLENNDNIAGYILGDVRVLNDGRRVYFISYFYIIKKFRNKGYGTKMILNVFNYCNNNNISFICLISKKNDNFFKKLGFTKDNLVNINNKNYEFISIMNNI